ncbi:MAG: hypothetical protein PHC54_06795, partial [Candidatus Omnitrophica bacterium]|nr:hypothetical protein [Candidatus Omnitrophota bacterium]
MFKSSVRSLDDWKVALEKIFAFIASGSAKNVIISGGENAEVPDKVMYCLERMPHNVRPHLFTSANWAQDLQAAREYLGKLWNAVKERPSLDKEGLKLVLQVSCDSFHQQVFLSKEGKLYENVPVRNIANILQVIAEEFPQIGVSIVSVGKLFGDSIFKEVELELCKRGYHFMEEISLSTSGDLWQAVSKQYGNHERIRTMEHVLSHDKALSIGIFIEPPQLLGEGLFLKPFEVSLSDKGLSRVKQLIRGSIPARLPFKLAETLSFDLGSGNISTQEPAAGLFVIGNIQEDDLTDLMNTAEHDPLTYSLDNDISLLYRLAKEAIPGLDMIALKLSNLISLAIFLTESPALRLYLTKRLLQAYAKRHAEDKGLEILKRIGLDVSREHLLSEYRINGKSEGGFSVINGPKKSYDYWRNIVNDIHQSNSSPLASSWLFQPPLPEEFRAVNADRFLNLIVIYGISIKERQLRRFSQFIDALNVFVLPKYRNLETNPGYPFECLRFTRMAENEAFINGIPKRFINVSFNKAIQYIWGLGYHCYLKVVLGDNAFAVDVAADQTSKENGGYKPIAPVVIPFSFIEKEPHKFPFYTGVFPPL